MWVVDDMLARPEPPLPHSPRITEVPVFTPDGHLQTELAIMWLDGLFTPLHRG